MATTDEHVVQATLDGDEYEQVREQAEKEDASVEELLRRALRAYLSQRKYVPYDDPMFEVVDELDESVGERTNAENMDEYVYGERWDNGEVNDEREDGTQRANSGSILDVVDSPEASDGDRTRGENVDDDVYGVNHDDEGENPR